MSAQIATGTVVVNAKMQQSVDVQVATSSDKQSMAPAPKTVEEQWENWLASYNMKEGWNPSDSPRVVIQSGMAVVRASRGDSKWVVARNAAFDMAELSAKQKLAELIKVEMDSGRFAEFASQGGETPAPMFSEPLKKVSIAQKTRILADKALDEAIKNFDPDWDGTGLSEEQRRDTLVTLQERFGRHISARARLFTSGAFVVTNFEGLNADGNYSVLVGLIWSMRLAKIAESIFNSEVTVEPVAPKEPISKQLEDMKMADPEFYCYANGVRVWTNERGERVIVSFGSVPATSSIMIDKDRASLVARSGIQTFVAELVETKGTIEGEFTYQETKTGQATFDGEAYQRRIDARAKSMVLQGAAPIKSWRGKHPVGAQRLQVVVIAWTPGSDTAARSLSKQLDQQEERMKKQGGAVAPKQKPDKGAGEPTATPTKQGPSSDPTNF